MPKPDKAQARQETKLSESVFDIAIEMLFIALVFLAPVIFDRRVGIVFSLTKVTVIRLLMIAIFTVWAVKLMLKQEHKFIRSPIDWPVVCYLFGATVAMLTSVFPLTSFEGFYGRYEGLSTIFIYGTLVFITTNFIKSKDQILRVMYTVITAAVCMSIYGVMQRTGLDPYAWGGVSVRWDVIGTIGQPNFFAAYLDMAFLITLSLLLNLKSMEWKNIFNKEHISDLLQRVLLLGILILFFNTLLFTSSRGGLTGLLGGISLLFIFSNRKAVLSKWRELALLLSMIAVFSTINYLNPAYSIFKKISGEVDRTIEMSARETPIVGYNATLSRVETWKSAYRIIVDHPLFGIGEEVLKMVFPRYETNKFRFYEGFHVKQDRCHNEVCDMAVTRGVITLAIYIWLIGTFIYMGLKIIRTDYDPQLKLFTASFLAGGASYWTQNQFSFGVVAITTLLWIMIGMTASIYVRSAQPEHPKDVDFSNMPWLLFAATLIIAILLMFISTIQFRADMHFKDGKGLADARQIDPALRELEASLKISPYEGGTWTYYGITTLNAGQISQNTKLIDRSIDIFAIANKIDPYNADNFYISGRAYYIQSLYNNSAIDKVLDMERKAIKIDPLYAEAYQILGSVYEKQGKIREAAEMFEKTVEINPQISDAVAGLSNLYLRLGESGKIIDVLNGFLKRYPGNSIFQENLAAVYVGRGDTKSALKIYEDMIAADNKNVKALVNYGFLIAKTGNMAKAKDSFQSAIMLDPRSVDAHNGLGLIYLKAGEKGKARDEFNQTLQVDPGNAYAQQMLGGIK